MASHNTYKCRFTCCECIFFSARTLMNHMTLCHVQDSSVSFRCNIDECQTFYSSVGAYRKHLARVHGNHWNANYARNANVIMLDNAVDQNEETDDPVCDLPEDGVDDCPMTIAKLRRELGNTFALTKLKIREMHMLPKSVAASIFEDIESIVHTCETGLQMIISNELDNIGCSFHNNAVLSECLESDSLFDDAFASTSSEYNFSKYCREHMNFIKPVPISVVVSDGAQVLVGHYVPILDYLKHYLQHTDVWASYQNASQSQNDLMFDYIDGSVWQSRGLPLNHLRLHLYSDEFEVCNPLGGKQGKHKVAAFYYTVGNVNVKYRSLQRNIHLAALIKYKSVRQFGYAAVIQPLIDDLKMLESTGIQIVVDSESFLVKGSVFTLSGDNLSQHALGGFNPSFRSGRVCRHCMERIVPFEVVILMIIMSSLF